MNKRYFLRGLGFGLMIGALVMMVTLHLQEQKQEVTATPSDAYAVIAGENTETGTTAEKSATEAITETATEITTEAEAEATTEAEAETTTEAEAETTTEATTEAEAEATTEAEAEATTEASTEAQKGGSITVTAGMSAQRVAGKLYDIGVIGDEEDFYMYMYNHGYASKILQGTFTFTGDEDYEEIANILMYTR